MVHTSRSIFKEWFSCVDISSKYVTVHFITGKIDHFSRFSNQSSLYMRIFYRKIAIISTKIKKFFQTRLEYLEHSSSWSFLNARKMADKRFLIYLLFFIRNILCILNEHLVGGSHFISICKNPHVYFEMIRVKREHATTSDVSFLKMKRSSNCVKTIWSIFITEALFMSH